MGMFCTCRMKVVPPAGVSIVSACALPWWWDLQLLFIIRIFVVCRVWASLVSNSAPFDFVPFSIVTMWFPLGRVGVTLLVSRLMFVVVRILVRVLYVLVRLGERVGGLGWAGVGRTLYFSCWDVSGK